METKNIQGKLKSIGINSPADLHEIIGGHPDLAYKIWNGRAPLSKGRAIKIKEETGASLDFLLG